MEYKSSIFNFLLIFVLVFNITSCNKKDASHMNTLDSITIAPERMTSNFPKAQLIYGWTEERVGELQKKTALAIGKNVKFNDTLYNLQSNGVLVGPKMVVIPAGIYEMGCQEDDVVCFPRERTAIIVKHKRPFAVSETEITEADWLLCVKDHVCKNRSLLLGNTLNVKHKYPVVNVNWHDAKAYVNWLSKKTNKNYRLLSESEWEYSAKAGSGSAYKLGNTTKCQPRQYNNNQNNNCYYNPNNHTEVRLIKQGNPNAFGLYDMHGNVWEWVEDCWSNSLLNTSSDGSAYSPNKMTKKNKCSFYLVKGGSWAGAQKQLRASHHTIGRESSFFNDQGLRIAREL